MSDVSLVVIMPVYNANKYVGKAIESILNQTFFRFQLIIINDGSSDDTSSILSYYQKNDRRIKVITNSKNIGLTRSLNRGINMTESDLVARMDSDDVSLPERFRAQVDFLTNHNNYAMVGVAWKEMTSDLKKTIRVMRPPVSYAEIKKKILIKNTFCHSAVMMRRKLLASVGGYDTKDLYSQDYDLWLRLISSYKVSNIKDVLHLRRIHNENLSHKNLKDQLHTMARSQKQYISITCKPRIYNVYVLKSVLLSRMPLSVLSLLNRLNIRRKPF